MNFGIILSKLRIERHLNQKDLGMVFGVSTSAIGMWETNKRFPDLNMLIKIANYFNVSTDYLLGLSPISSSPQESVHGEQLSEDESKLLNTYRSLESDEKQIVLGKALDLKLSSTTEARKKKDIG